MCLESFQLIYLMVFSILFYILLICKLMYDLYSILLKIPDVISTRSNNEVDINLKLSINLSLHVIVLLLLQYSQLVQKKVIYFSTLSPIRLSSPLNSIAN